MAEPMTLQIITPDAIVFEGQSTFFVGKAIDGGFGILPNHAPMIIALDLAPLNNQMEHLVNMLYLVASVKLNIIR
jgi:F0F1-type ATP synthase epsilon subunit